MDGKSNGKIPFAVYDINIKVNDGRELDPNAVISRLLEAGLLVVNYNVSTLE